MNKPIIVDSRDNIPHRYDGWVNIDTPFRNIRFEGRQYVLIEERGKRYSVGQRIGRAILGALAVIGTAFIGLTSEKIRGLFTAQIQTKQFVKLSTDSDSDSDSDRQSFYQFRARLLSGSGRIDLDRGPTQTQSLRPDSLHVHSHSTDAERAIAEQIRTDEELARAIAGSEIPQTNARIDITASHRTSLPIMPAPTHSEAVSAQTNTGATTNPPATGAGGSKPADAEIKSYWSNSSNNFRNGRYERTSQDGYIIKTSRWLVKNYPEKTLEKLYNRCFNNSIPRDLIRIELLTDDLKKDIFGKFVEDAATDAGGVSRDIIGVLFSSLTEKALSREGILKFNKDLKGAFPVTKDGNLTGVEADLYEAMGKIMGMCYTQGEAVIGNVFHSNVYEVLKMLSKKNTSYRPDDNTLLSIYQTLKKGCNDEILSLYNEQDYRNDAIVQQMFEIVADPVIGLPDGAPAALQGTPTPDTIRENMDYIKKELKSLVLDDAKSHFPPLLHIAAGMRTHRPFQNWTHIDTATLKDKVQGVFSPDAVKRALIGPSPIKEWMMKWIDEKSDEEIKNFVRTTTGSDALGVGKQIALTDNLTYRRKDNLMPEYHTCYMRADFSNYSDYESFKAMLDKSVEYALAEGFGQL